MSSETGVLHRRSLRLAGYDYSQVGAYFVTVCVQNRSCLFGEIVAGEMRLNDRGGMVTACWEDLPTRFGDLETDQFVVMPNHLHGIVLLGIIGCRGEPCVRPDARRCVGDHKDRPYMWTTRPRGTLDGSLGRVIQTFKSITTDRYIRGVRCAGWPPFAGRLWQRNYYEHVIRDEDELKRIRQYILDNPPGWAEDSENPDAVQL